MYFCCIQTIHRHVFCKGVFFCFVRFFDNSSVVFIFSKEEPSRHPGWGYLVRGGFDPKLGLQYTYVLSWAGVKRRDLLIIISRITHNRTKFQSRLRIQNASSVLASPTHNTLIITLDVFCLLIMFTRQSSCFVHFSWFLLIMASQSNGLGFVVPWRGMHEVLLLVCFLQSMRGSIQGPGFPGAQAHGWGGWSISRLGSPWHQQTHNLLIIHFIFSACLACMSVFVQFTHMDTHNTYS
jgi:general stress protein CsbA